MKKNDKITVITCAAAFALNVALFSVKLYVGLCANSISIYSDAVNNMFDSLSGLAAFICFAALLSSSSEGTRAIIKKAEQFFSFVMSVIILLTGLYFAYNSLERLFYPTPISYLTRYLVMLIVTVAVKFVMFFAYRGVYRITGSPIIKVMTADSILDCFITLATVMSLTVSQYVEFAVDAVFGLVISTVLITLGSEAREKIGRGDARLRRQRANAKRYQRYLTPSALRSIISPTAARGRKLKRLQSPNSRKIQTKMK